MKRGIYRILSYFSEVTELPLSEMCRDFSVSLVGRRELTVDGVMSINRYEKDHIVLEVKGGVLHIAGGGLLLKTFYQTTLCIRGEINKVEWGESACGI